MSDEHIDSIIRSSFLSQYVYSKVQFDNAKDTTALIAAADASAQMLSEALKQRLQDHKEEIIAEWIEGQR